jgi:hypothetical protein
MEWKIMLSSPCSARLLLIIGLLATPMTRASSQAAKSDTVVRVAGAPVHAAVATLVEELSIGALDGAEEYTFGDISEVAIAGDGSIYVFDRQVPALRKYDARGKYIRTLGGRGQGPGEYLKGGGLAVHPDGRVMLWDSGTWRINVYSLAGEPVATWSTPSGASGTVSLNTSHALVIDSAGVIWLRRSIIDPEAAARPRTEWVRLNGTGAPIDTLAEPVFAVVPRTLSATNRFGTRTSAIPFEPATISAVSSRGYFVTGYPQRYAFEMLVPTASGAAAARRWRPGDPIVSVRRTDAKAIAVSRAQRDSARRVVEERMRRTDPRWNWDGPAIPGTHPYYTRIVSGLDGRIWLSLFGDPTLASQGTTVLMQVGNGAGGAERRAPPPSRAPIPATLPSTPMPYDVFEPSGAYVGRVEIPARVVLGATRGDLVWGVAYNDDDVGFLKRYRIAWGP